ncbi:MAG TPA: glycosyltransferase family 4 protein [Solirubrobacteraceae bacterium]|jgi:glycosyltransferase involved in cell wall biosynthesis|nr:glycosyltransferase family 4 protein [Solirubrobacteraceae bacterium]
MIRVDLVDPSAYTPPYDHALASALARNGASVRLITSRFPYGEVPPPEGYVRATEFYRRARGPAGSRLRRALKLAEHLPDMARYRRSARAADIVHFQWLSVPLLDLAVLPDRPVVLTAHDLLPREPRPGQVWAQRRLLHRVRAVIVHSEYGRRVLVDQVGVDPGRVHVIHHGAFHDQPAGDGSLPPELPDTDRPVVLYFGLIRPYKGLDVLLAAWEQITGAELWVVGRPLMDIAGLRGRAPDSVRWVPRFVSDDEVAGLLRRADVVVLPYTRTERFDQSGVLASALGSGKAIVLTDIGGFGEVAATGAARLVAPGDPQALAAGLREVLEDPEARRRLEQGARSAARGPYSWDAAARLTLTLYETILAA